MVFGDDDADSDDGGNDGEIWTVGCRVLSMVRYVLVSSPFVDGCSMQMTKESLVVCKTAEIMIWRVRMQWVSDLGVVS